MTSKIDLCERFAEASIANPVKARMRAAQTRRERAAAKALSERDLLFKWWKKWRNKRRTELIERLPAARALAEFLDQMSIDDGAELMQDVRVLPPLDRDARFQLLALIDARIIFLREKEGWPPFDDSLPGSRPTLFEACRSELL
jgi:hypothetical protein